MDENYQRLLKLYREEGYFNPEALLKHTLEGLVRHGETRENAVIRLLEEFQKKRLEREKRREQDRATQEQERGKEAERARALPASLPFSPKEIEAMVTKKAAYAFAMGNMVWNIPIASERGKKALEDLASELQLKFPVELALMPNREWSEYNPLLMILKKDEKGGFVLSMKHRANYNARDTLVRAIHFLIGAKMIETAFPGMMIEGDRKARDIFAEIAYQIREPYFLGGETPGLGRVYPYPVFRGGQDLRGVEYAIYKAIIIFYQQELLTRINPTGDLIGLEGDLYEFELLTTLVQGPKSLESMIYEIAVVAAESKLNYGRKRTMLPAFISINFETLVESYGSDLFLEILKARYGSATVQTTYSIISQLPLEGGKGFGPPILHDIYKVVNRLYVFLSRGQVLEIEEIHSHKLNLTIKGEFGGLRGKIALEKGPAIAFIGTE